MPKELSLPDLIIERQVTRLRGMADAIERGMGLTDVATLYRIPLRVLHRVAMPPQVGPTRRKKPAIPQLILARAAARVRAGEHYDQIAAELNVNVGTLIKELRKIGVTMRGMDRAGRVQTIDDAIKLYVEGVKVLDIAKQTGIHLNTLYAQIKKSGVTPLREHRKPTGRPAKRQPSTRP